MKLHRLDIQQLPGISAGFSVHGFEPGVNVVTGPNGIGKSSLVRALHLLLGEVETHAAVALSAELHDGASRYEVRRTGRVVQWKKDGETIDRPPLPARDRLSSYLLGVESLLAAEQQDASLLDALRVELAGGYDLAALPRTCELEVGARVGTSEAHQLTQAEQRLRVVEHEQVELRSEEAQLPDLVEAIEGAQAAVSMVRDLESALDRVDARREVAALEAKLETFPENMERLRGDEGTRLDELEHHLKAAANQLSGARTVEREARSDLQATGLDNGGPAPAELRAEQTRVEQARRVAEGLEDQGEQLSRARVLEAQALAQLGGRPPTSPRLDPSAIAEAEALARHASARSSEVAALAQRVDDAPEAPPEGELERLRQATSALRRWLAAEKTRELGFWLAFLAALLAAGAATARAAQIEAWWATAGAAAALFALAVAALLGRDDRRQRARADLEATRLDPPEAWASIPVEARLEELEDRLRKRRDDQMRAREAQALEPELRRARQALNRTNEQVAEAAARLGFDPRIGAVSFDRLLRCVHDHQQAEAERRRIEAETARRSGDLDALLGRIADFLTRWGLPNDGTLATADAQLSALAERAERARAARERQTEARREITRIDSTIEDLEARVSALYHAAGLADHERIELGGRLRRLDAWSELQSQHAAAVAVAAERDHRPLPAELLEAVEADDRDALERALPEAQARAARLRALIERRSEIQARIDAAGSARRLEVARAEVQERANKLADKLDRVLDAEAGSFLLDAVKQEHASDREPRVLTEAKTRFAGYTGHEWGLELHEREGFVAREHASGEIRRLGELSSGTRMQLLLAVRMGSTRMLEDETFPIPFVLDEALTTSDEKRFAEVAKTLAQFADEERRQIIYLTAREDDLALWADGLGRTPRHIPLDAEQQSPPLDEHMIVLPPAPQIPKPGTLTAAEYGGALGVPPVQPALGVGRVHVFHVLRDDLELLHHLLERGYARLGPLAHLLAQPAGEVAIPDPERRARLSARIAAASIWVETWRKGRGRTVDRNVLEKADGVSDTFLDRVASLAEAVEGDGLCLVEKLRAGELARFREASVDELETWLFDQGYIFKERPLDAEARRRATYEAACEQEVAAAALTLTPWLERGAQPASPAIDGADVPFYNLENTDPAPETSEDGHRGGARP